MKTHLRNNSGFKWFEDSNIKVKGYLIDQGGKLYKGEDLIKYFIDIEDEKILFEKIKNSNGNFVCLLENGNKLYIIIDHIRSFPIFYLKEDDHIIISDQAYYLKEKSSQLVVDEDSIYEYLMTGYVTSENTIYEEIKQLNAGECLIYDKVSKHIEIKNYININVKTNEINNTEKIFKDFDEVLKNIFEELVVSLDGRTAVMPLSGGYDSRLIALYLKSIGYNNVICYTYGNEVQTEVKIAKELANYLEYDWYFVPQARDEIYKKFNSERARGYHKFSNNLSTTPHIQDLYAVSYLKKHNILPDDSVFIPGHTSINSFRGLTKELAMETEFEDFIFNKHYYFWDKKLYERPIIEMCKFRIKESLRHNEYSDEYDLTKKIYHWEWQELESKFICNSIRVYEFNNYEWRMPLWDKRLMKFWNSLPVDYKFGKNSLKEFMKERFPMPISQANPDRNIIKKINDELLTSNKLAEYEKSLFKALIMKNKDISIYAEKIPFIDSNKFIIFEEYNALAALKGLDEILKV